MAGSSERSRVSGKESNEYEECRAQRIKENNERLKSLGIIHLSNKLTNKKKKKKTSSTSSSTRNCKTLLPPNHSPRRSSRLKGTPPVSYVEKKLPSMKNKSVDDSQICIPPGDKPEFYTDEHLKLLGDSKAPWTLMKDGYDDQGQRLYDHVQGKTCHQCRQKTLGRRTECSKCKLVTGQLCGDCLYMRYGENVIEVNQNPDWVCAVCRGICNCSRCRHNKGWAPTGSIYKKVVSIGFKSAAHYLIHTFHERAVKNAGTGENPVSIDGSLSFEDGIHFLCLQLMRGNLKQDSDENENEDGDVDSQSSN